MFRFLPVRNPPPPVNFYACGGGLLMAPIKASYMFNNTETMHTDVTDA